MKKVLALVSSIILLGASSVYAAPAANSTGKATIAVVNVQQLFQNSPRIADLNKKLQEKFKVRQEKLMTSQKSLQGDMEKLKKESPTMSKKDQETLKNKITKEQTTLAKEAADFQQDLNKEQGKVMKDVLAQLNSVIAKIAKSKDFTLVLDSQAVIYAADKADITSQVSKEFDKK